jgi:hypothetical protein
MRTIVLEDGKYEFDVDDLTLIVAIRRHGESWPAALDLRYSKLLRAMLVRILSQADEIDRLRDGLAKVAHFEGLYLAAQEMAENILSKRETLAIPPKSPYPPSGEEKNG